MLSTSECVQLRSQFEWLKTKPLKGRVKNGTILKRIAFAKLC